MHIAGAAMIITVGFLCFASYSMPVPHCSHCETEITL